jgi:hypothetical protein
MKAATLFRAVLIGTILFSAASVAASDDTGPESMSLFGGKRGDVTFPHAKHQEFLTDCMPCHDIFPKESQIIEKMKADGKLKKKVVMNMCKKCHKDLSKKGQEAGPTSCKGCNHKS